MIKYNRPEFTVSQFNPDKPLLFFKYHLVKGAVTRAVCPESAWLVTFFIGNVSTGVVIWSSLRCGASDESGKKVAAAPLSKTAAAAAAAKTWFAKHQLNYMLHDRFPWKRSGRHSSICQPYSLRLNLSAAACRPCDRSLRLFKFSWSLSHEQKWIFCCTSLWSVWLKLSVTSIAVTSQWLLRVLPRTLL